jgi:alpha-L-fucosidase
MRNAFRLIAFTAFSFLESAAQPPADSMRWFQEARFGMFIHWSIASAEGLEGSWPIMMPGALPKLGNVTDAEYKAFAQRFHPKAFRPEDWIRLAKAAGQKYMVFTTKHHDGFALFDSKYTNYKVTKTPYAKDVLAELVAACEREKMPLGFYYSPPDLDHPGYRDVSKPAKDNYYGEPARPEWPLYLDYMELQLEELLTRYGRVPVMWFDGFKETPWSPARFEAVVRRLQPNTLINNRLGSLADFDISENVFPRRIPTKSKPIVQGTPSRIVRADISNEVPALKDFRPWEMCVPMNETWTYNPNDKQFKSTEDLIRTLVEVASRGGNFLLNVGPKADGAIQSEVEERLLGMGDWLKKNGEAIYGTTYGPVQGHAALRSTAKANQIYLHVFDWPKSGELLVSGVPGVIKSAMVLANGKAVRISRKGAAVVLKVPDGLQDSPVTVVKLSLAKAWIPGSK